MGTQLGSRLRVKRGMTQLRARERPLFFMRRLPARVSASSPPNTVMIEIKAIDKGPAQVALTADAVVGGVSSFVQNTREKMQNVARTSPASVVWDAILPASPYGHTCHAEMERP